TDLHLPMELKQPLHLPAVLRAEASPAEGEDHRVRALHLGKLAALAGVVSELVVGERRARNDIGSHGQICKERSLGARESGAKRSSDLYKLVMALQEIGTKT